MPYLGMQLKSDFNLHKYIKLVMDFTNYRITSDLKSSSTILSLLKNIYIVYKLIETPLELIKT